MVLHSIGFGSAVDENVDKLRLLALNNSNDLEMTFDIGMEEITSAYENDVYGKELKGQLEPLVSIMRFSQVLGSVAVTTERFSSTFQKALDLLKEKYGLSPDIYANYENFK